MARRPPTFSIAPSFTTAVVMEKRVTFKNAWLPYLLLAPQLAITAVFFLWPASQALFQSMLLEDPFGLRTEFVWFDNFQELIDDPLYLRSMGTTAVFSLSTAALALSSALLLAVMADRVIKGAAFYKLALLWPYAVAPAVAAVLQQQQTAPAPRVVNTSSPSPAPVTTSTQPSQRVSQAAATAMRSMAQLQTRARQPITRMNLRQPQLRNVTMAAQSSLLQQARSRLYRTAVDRPAYQSRSTAFNRAQPSARSLTSPTRTVFLRQPLQASAMNRGSYARMSTRGPQRPANPTSSSAGSRVASNMGNRAGQMAGYQRMNTRQPATAADRFGSLMNRAHASAADARNSGMRPVPASVTQNGQGTRLQWLSQNGARYQVQSSSDRTSWRNVGTPRSGRPGSDSMPIQPGGPRYYRVVRSN